MTTGGERVKRLFVAVLRSRIHATSKKFENSAFTLKTHQMFSVHTTGQKNLETQQSAVSLDLWLRKNRAAKSRDYRDVIVLEKLRFQNVFCSHKYENPALYIFLWVEEYFRKALFSWRIWVWMVGLNVDIKLSFEISKAYSVDKILAWNDKDKTLSNFWRFTVRFHSFFCGFTRAALHYNN